MFVCLFVNSFKGRTNYIQGLILIIRQVTKDEKKTYAYLLDSNLIFLWSILRLVLLLVYLFCLRLKINIIILFTFEKKLKKE